MKEYRMAIISKCLKLSVMFFPILLWIYYLCLQCFISFPSGSFMVVTVFIDLCLVCSVLFGNSFIKLTYLEDQDEILFEIQKVNSKVFLKNALFSSPVLLCFFPSFLLIFIAYIILQIIYMYVDKRHFTMIERALFILKNKINEKRKKAEVKS